MKKLDNLSTYLFLLLTVILFLFALSLVFDKSLDLKFYPWDKEKFRYHLNLDDYQRVEEKIIPLALFLNREDNEIYFWLGDYFERKGDLNKAADSYQKVIDFAPFLSFEPYKRQLKVFEKLKLKEEKEKLLLFLFEKIEGKGYLAGFGVDPLKEFYKNGESYLKEGNWQKTAFWWEKTIKISPEWSYFYLELASLYYQNGQLERAREVLENCLKRKDPQEHCQEYLNSQMTQFKKEKPGFWQEKILEIR
jgi:tetratricopeptide (TPR) repeat protein